MSDREILEQYRHRNTKGSWSSPENIHTFRPGMRVIRSSERAAFEDRIDEEGIIAEIVRESGYVHLEVDTKTRGRHRWGTTEATPYRAWAERNGRRLRQRAAGWSRLLATLDELGHPKPIGMKNAAD